MAHRDTFVEVVVALDNPACIAPSDLPALCSGSKAAFEVRLTWVRVYGEPGNYSYSVNSGAGEIQPALTFDQVPNSMSGHFNYCAPLAQPHLSPGTSLEFDYHTWIVQHLLN